MSSWVFVRKCATALLTILLLTLEPTTYREVFASDLDSFSIARAAFCCNSIVLARFVRELKGEKSIQKTGLRIGDFHAFYSLKGAPYARDLPILINPVKVSGCSAASKQLIPKNSIWIVFIDSPLRKFGALEPYAGGAGILPYSESALSEILTQSGGAQLNPNALQTAKNRVQVELDESQRY